MMIVILRRLFYKGFSKTVSENRKSLSNKAPYLDVPSYHITECNLKVLQKEIKGFLGECQEDGSREIKVEIIDCFEKTKLSGLFEKRSSPTNSFFNFFWLIYQKTSLESIKKLLFRLLMTNTKVPETINKRKKQILVYFHGGGYCYLNSSGYRRFLSKVSKACNIKILAIDYRLAPEHPFPSALFDAVYTFLALTENEGAFKYSPEDIFVGGDSAGGGLSLALTCYLRDFGYKLPKGLSLISPWVDLTLSTNSHHRNHGFDYLQSIVTPKSAFMPNHLYSGKESIENKYISPIFNKFHSLPDTLIISGELECLVDESIKVHQEIDNQNNSGNTKLYVYKEMVHVFPIFTFTAYSRMAIKNIADFIKEANEEQYKGSKEIIFV